MNELSDDLLIHILQYICFSDEIITLRLVCKLWNNLSIKNTICYIEKHAYISGKILRLKVDVDVLTELDLSSCYITSENLETVSNFVNLTYLNLSNNFIEEIDMLSNLVKLKYLNLYYNKVHDLRPLESLVNLTFLDLGFNEIFEYFSLKLLTSLIDLDISYNCDIDPEVLECLKKIENIKY